MTTRSVPATSDPSSEAAYHALRDRIMTLELAPGQWLIERRSAVELGLGLAPVRNALARLVQDGLLQVVPRTGYQVTPLTRKSVNDLFTAWALLGPEIVRLGTGGADPGQAAELRRLMAEGNAVLAGPLDRDHLVRYIDITEQVLALLAVASHNERLVEVNRSLTGEMGRALALILTAPGAIDAFLTAGTRWDSTISRRDAATATATARDVIAVGHTAAMRTLHGRPPGTDRAVLPLRR